MGNPFTTTTITNYNTNPPSDDGAQTASNRVQWSTQKTKLSDPIKTAFDTSETNTGTAFSKIPGGAGITATALDYTVQAQDQGSLIRVTASGKTITTPDATVVGNPFLFRVLNESSGDLTIDGFGTQTVDGVLDIIIPAGAGVVLDNDGSNWFTNGQNFIKTNIAPQGRLTLVTATPVMSSDQTGKTAVFFTPYYGDQILIPNGTTFTVKTFTELTLTLVSNHLADTLYDIFGFFDPADGTTLTIGTGPAWSTTTAGSSARGTGAGTTELAMLKGFPVNNVAATMRNGTTTYSVGAKSAIYLGSLYTDHTAGQVSCHFSFGQNRKFGIWNMFNRVPIILKAGDSTASWNYNTNTIRASNNVPATWSSAAFNVGSGTACNGSTILCGLSEEDIYTDFKQKTQLGAAASVVQNFVGVNSVTVASGFAGIQGFGSISINPFSANILAEYISAPVLGITTIASLENTPTTGGATNQTFFGTEAGMTLMTKWRG